MDDITSTVNDLSVKAVQYGKSFSKKLDYSERSLKDIEEILDYYYKDLKGNLIRNIFRKIKNQQQTDSQIWSMATIWGVYVGEVMCKNNQHRCKWVYEDGFGSGPFLHIKVDNNNRACPIDKVYKRLKNGAEDNIVSFYNIFKDMVLTGKLSANKVSIDK